MHSQVRRSVLMDGVPASYHSVAHTNVLQLDNTTASDTDDDTAQDETQT